MAGQEQGTHHVHAWLRTRKFPKEAAWCGRLLRQCRDQLVACVVDVKGELGYTDAVHWTPRYVEHVLHQTIDAVVLLPDVLAYYGVHTDAQVKAAS